jgi:hypothetical protein
VAFVAEGKHQRLRYCSDACARASCSNTNRLPVEQQKAVPVGRHFWRTHDGAECVVMADSTGLPYAEALRECNFQTA